MFRHIVSALTVAVAMLTSIASTMRLWSYRQRYDPKAPCSSDGGICRPVSAQDAVTRDFVLTAQAP